MGFLTSPKTCTETPIAEYFCARFIFFPNRLRLDPTTGASLWAAHGHVALILLLKFYIHFIATTHALAIIITLSGEHY